MCIHDDMIEDRHVRGLQTKQLIRARVFLELIVNASTTKHVKIARAEGVAYALARPRGGRFSVRHCAQAFSRKPAGSTRVRFVPAR